MNRVYIFYFLLFFITGSGCQPSSAVTSDESLDILSEEHKSDWSGSPDHWRWENGMLIGETTEENPVEHSSFLIWNREVQDFILKISFRISPQGNSGIYYRSGIGPEGYDKLLGYQADIDGRDEYTGIVYENFLDRHHKILARRGQFVRISETDSVQAFPISTLDPSNKDLIHQGSWNEYELIVKGNLIIQKLNGNLISMVEDQFPNRLQKGKFGFQLHQGPPMKVEFRDAKFIEVESSKD